MILKQCSQAGIGAALVMAGSGAPSEIGEIWVTCRGSWKRLLELGWVGTLCLRIEAWDEVSSKIRWGLGHPSSVEASVRFGWGSVVREEAQQRRFLWHW